VLRYWVTTQEISKYEGMKRLSEVDYLTFKRAHHSVMIDGSEVVLETGPSVTVLGPEGFHPEEWTVWNFPDRGRWATHVGNYRGNWSPYVPRNLIERYTQSGDTVCDPMMGSGTTLVECKLMGRNAIGVDVNVNACMIAMNRLDFKIVQDGQEYPIPKIEFYQGDVRNLDLIINESVDLVATHPPYCSIISYSGGQIPGDLSELHFDEFIREMGVAARECFRVLKPGKYCAILTGGTRKYGHYVPIHIGMLAKFLDAGFILNEEIIKLQHNTKSMKEWAGATHGFYKIAHEHLYVLRKPTKNEDPERLGQSKKWW
jgi:DNA modification methylase